MTAPVISRLRCPLEHCGHFPNRIETPPPELLDGLDEWRHVVFCGDDRGHVWTVAWTTEKEMT